MATYVVPQALVYQEISQVPQADIQPLPACIVGPHAHLVRYSESDEKEFGLLGDYDELVDTDYSWPNRPTGGVVDDDYTRVYIDDALLRYFEDTIGSGDTIQTVAGQTNRVRASATSFVSNGAAYPRTAASFFDRDVAVGDVAKLRAVVGSDEYELCTYVAGFVSEVIAAVVAAATADAANQADDVAATSFSQTAGGDNCVDISSVDGATYDGLEDGDVEETYTILCTKTSVGGDATTAELRVTSASGNDDVATVTPSAFGVATAIGTRGLTVTWDNTHGVLCSVSAVAEGLDVDDFLAGQTWEVTVAQNFTAPTATSGGTYAGTTDVTYIIRVSKGGLYADEPEITVTTDTGVDVSGPTAVTGAATAVAVGTQGVTVQFNQLGLSKDDRYYIECDAADAGAVQTLILGHSFDQDVIDNGATEVDLTLYIRKDIEVPQNRTGAAPLTNWDMSATQISINSGITAFDDSWTNAGVPMALPVVSDCTYGQVYVHARYWRSDLCSEANQLYDSAQMADISGPLHPDNPLKWGVFKALQNSNGIAVTYVAVCDPDDVDEWSKVLEIIDGDRRVYGIVPLTRTATVWSLFQAHVNSQSSPRFGRWRYLWLNLDEITEKEIIDDTTSDDEAVVLAVLEDDPQTSGTQYTLLRVPAANASFVTNGVRAGDIVRYLYEGDGFGNDTYTEFVVDAVLSEDSLRLQTGHTLPVSVASKMEIWRNLTETEEAAEYTLTEGYSDRRVMMTWPHEVGQDGYTVEGYFLNCCLAGLVSGVVPQQGLTNLEISGCDDLTETTRFNRTQLDAMAGGGVWVVTQDPNSGDVFSRHALSTADYDTINEREELITRNLDSISYYFLDIYSPYIGVSNVTESTLDMLRAETHSGIKFLESRYFLPRLGSQLISGTISRMRAHATLLDRIIIDLDLVLPYPLNNIEAHLRLVA